MVNQTRHLGQDSRQLGFFSLTQQYQHLSVHPCSSILPGGADTLSIGSFSKDQIIHHSNSCLLSFLKSYSIVFPEHRLFVLFYSVLLCHRQTDQVASWRKNKIKEFQCLIHWFSKVGPKSSLEMQIIKFLLEVTDLLQGPAACILTTPPGDGMLDGSLHTFDLDNPYPQTTRHTQFGLNIFRNKCFGFSRVKQFTSTCKFSGKFHQWSLAVTSLESFIFHRLSLQIPSSSYF